VGPPEGIAPAPHQRQREPALPRPPGACGWLQVTREELKVMGGLPPLDHNGLAGKSAADDVEGLVGALRRGD
jgi:hypothetical protein